jgi:hypothetical protein
MNGCKMQTEKYTNSVTKRRNETQEGRKHRDSRNQRNIPKRKDSLTTETRIMLLPRLPRHNVHTSHLLPAHCTNSRQHNTTKWAQRRVPEHPCHRSTRSTEPSAGTEGMPGVPCQTGSPHHTQQAHNSTTSALHPAPPTLQAPAARDHNPRRSQNTTTTRAQ